MSHVYLRIGRANKVVSAKIDYDIFCRTCTYTCKKKIFVFLIIQNLILEEGSIWTWDQKCISVQTLLFYYLYWTLLIWIWQESCSVRCEFPSGASSKVCSDFCCDSSGIEARGFIFGPAIALAIGAKFIPLRKPKKLPGEVHLNMFL
jgi:hypothetical protein